MKLKFGFKLWVVLTLVIFLIKIGGCREIINKLKTRELMDVLSHEAPLYRGESASPVLVDDDPLLKWIKADVGVITLAKFPKEYEVGTRGGCQEILVSKKAKAVYINAVPPTTPKAASKTAVSWTEEKIIICSPKGVRATIVLWYE